ncbi:MAG: hypothetical protein NTX38_14550 [Methylobacter sp.]|nr:hypothetical protein [Methylobacter sp.]
MNAIGVSILMILMAVVFCGPRRWALVGMMAGVLYLTNAQLINLFGLNLFAIRFLELAGFTRILIRKEFSFSKLNGIDRVVLLLYIYSTLVFLLRSKVDLGSHIAMMMDAIFCYFTFRALIISTEDLKWFLGVFAVILFPYVALVTVDMLTHHNPFTLIGGRTFVERQGRLRCMGTFANPSLLGGALGASFVPLYIGLFFAGNHHRVSAVAGIVLCLGIVFLSNSGGPLSAAALGIVGWVCWFVKARMSLIRRLLVCILFIIGLFMKAPIWYLVAKVSSISGGDGYHRSYLMDIAFQNFSLWWLTGMDLMLTKDWFPYQVEVTGYADITNQYLEFGLGSGLLSMVLFILLLVLAFKVIGKALEAVRSPKKPVDAEYLLWGLGCSLTVHISTWFGITYTFDQSNIIWFMHLAAISSISESCIETKIQITQDIPFKKDRIIQSIYKKGVN